MALFPRVTTWVSNQVLTASALNGEFNNILNNAQASSWIGFSANVAQMQQQTSPGGVGSESLAGSIADELQRIRFMLAFLSGQTFWYDQTGSTLGTNGIQTASINDQAVTAAKIANGAITTTQISATAGILKTQLVSLGQQVSASSGNFGTTNNSFVDVTNLSVTITTTGRPVAFLLIADGSANTPLIGATSSGNVAGCVFTLNDVGAGTILAGGPVLSSTFTTPTAVNIPPPGLFHVQSVAAGTHTYKIQLRASNVASSALCYYMKLMVYEL